MVSVCCCGGFAIWLLFAVVVDVLWLLLAVVVDVLWFLLAVCGGCAIWLLFAVVVDVLYGYCLLLWWMYYGYC